MQLPIVSVTAHYNDGNAVYSNLNVISIGYAIHQAWVFGVLFNTTVFFGDTLTAIVSPAGSQSISVVYISSIIVYLLVLLLMGVFTEQSTRLLESRRVMPVFGLVACMGTLLTFYTGPDVPFALSASVLAGAFTGIGSAAGIEYWGYVYAQEMDSSSLLNTAVSLPITMLVFGGILMHLPYPVGGIVLSLLPLFEIVLLWRKLPSRDARRARMELGKTLPVSRHKLIACLGVPLFFCGFAVGYLRNASMAVGEDVLSGGATALLIVVATAACVLLLAIVFVVGRGRSESWDGMFQITAAIAFIAVIFAPELLDMPNSTLTNCVLSFGYFSFGGFLWAFYAAVSQNYRISPVLVFGIGRGITAVSATFISVAPALAEMYWTPFLSNGYAYIALILVMLAMGFITMPNHRRLSIFIGRDAEDELAAQPQEDDMCVLQGMTAASCGLQADDDLCESQESEDCQAEPEPVPAEELPEAATVAAEDQGVQAPAPYADAQPQAPAGPSTEMLYHGCEAVSKRFLLSQRETEVLLLLALGRNSVYIQKTLYISEGTAKTHIRHIYRKTGVHKQQELIDLVEEVAEQ